VRRREFITLLGGAAFAWPLGARAQQPAMPVIGFLSSRSPGESSGVVAALRRGLSEAGFVEGQNTVIAFRWAEGAYDRLPALAADLISLRVAVLVAAGGTPSLIAAEAATTTIPIVFTAVIDPVQLGFVPSFNRPGGNVTGISLFNNALLAKRVGLLHEVAPTASMIAMLRNPNSPVVEDDMKSVLATAQSLGLTCLALASNGPGRIYDEKSALWIQFRVEQSPDDYVTSRLTKGKPAEHALTWQAADQVELAIAKALSRD